jgi:hypothetical protein
VGEKLTTLLHEVGQPDIRKMTLCVGVTSFTTPLFGFSTPTPLLTSSSMGNADISLHEKYHYFNLVLGVVDHYCFILLLYIVLRADSSILGQRKKNQRRARNKRKNMAKRQNSESEDVFSEPETMGSSNITTPALPTAQHENSKETKPAEFISDLMFDIDM